MNGRTVLSWFLIIPAMVLQIAGCKTSSGFNTADRDRLFNSEWKFIRDSLPPDAWQTAFQDSGWITVDLPHDWSISNLPRLSSGSRALPGKNQTDQIGPFSKESPGKTATGYVLGGTGWYRKHFTLDKHDEGKTACLRFDGVYMETDVWVNGRHAGTHTYGYTPFWFDITPLLNPAGEENIIAVKVSNTGRNSRWYSGSGIFRNVVLTLTQPVHVAVWGVRVVTPVVTDVSAKIAVDVTIQNDGKRTGDIRIISKVLDQDKRIAGWVESTARINASDKITLHQPVDVEKPVLWSTTSPYLYTAEISVEVNGKITDQYNQPFGIRTIDVSAEKGLLLNGKPIKLKGGCLHHDNGLLGSAAIDRAEERRVEIMKANGFNAIRTSHNPPSEAFLNACDHLGMLVIDETFDMWERFKNPQDYHRFFREWWKKDVEAMIMRDRNHPSVVFWSIGNEISERADTSGIRIAKSLISFIRKLDSTRFFTNAICEFWDHPGTSWEVTTPAFELLTAGGYNYQWRRYESDHQKFPQRIMMGTESVPMEAFENWQMVIKNPWVIGDFVWTGMDYLGETGIGHTRYLTKETQDTFAMAWPWFNAWCGDVDITGNKKPQMLYRDVIWGNSRLEMNIHAPMPEGKTEKISYWGWYDEYPGWNWKGNEDKPLRVSVYSTGTSVRLELNSRVIGEKETSVATKLKATFDVPYEPGELRAVALENGREIAMKTLKTTGEPAEIRLTADRNPIRADRNDLTYITVEVVDEFGQVVTDAAVQVELTLKGNGELIGSGNACPYDMESFGNRVIKTYRGKALAIVRPFAKAGTIRMKASAGRLKDGVIEVKAE
jgi:beta-galactosidase